ncbi:MAG: DUF1320 domain-containing protein [Desulfuromonas sp.]|nr:MAG: DUF1320 domain-containing protein [Desulfuromonas sp.]
MYCTQDDILTRRLDEASLIQLPDQSDTGEVDATVVTAAITEAGEIIDGYMRGRYVLPLSPVPGAVRNLAVDLAVYALYGRSGWDTPQRVKDDHANALRLLGQIQAGKVQIGATVITTSPAEGSGAMHVQTPPRMFDHDTLENY